MSRPTDRDPSIERALMRDAESFSDPLMTPGPNCVDAETLAMWVEGSLPPARATAVEEHMADCHRCLDVVSVLAQTEAAAAAPQPAAAPWLERWWLPIAGGIAAATLLAIVLIDRRDAAPAPESTQAQAVAPAEPAAIAAQAPSSTAARAAAPPPPTPPALSTPKPVEKNTAPPSAAPAPTPAPRPAPPAPALPATVTAAAPPPPPPSRPAQAPPVTPWIVSATPPAADRSTLIRSNRQDLAATAAREAFALGMIVEFSSPAGGISAGSADPAGGVVGAAAGGGRGGGRGGRGAPPSASGISTPIHWRITTAATLEKSVDERATWTPVPLGPDAAPVSGGVAPTRLICWLVGREGVIYRSVDATTFVRVPFAEPLDLVRITATDALNAIVTTTNGRQFSTADGGRTWVER